MTLTRIRMQDDLAQQLDVAAARMQRSKGSIVNDAVREYLAREALATERLAGTRAALDELTAGELLDGDAVMAWLDSWGRDDEQDPPGR